MTRWRRFLGRRTNAAPARIIRTYGRDSLLVWANVLVAPLVAVLGLRLGLRSEEHLAARIEADATLMRRRGYLVASVERRSLPVVGASRTDAHWYRVTYERAAPASEPGRP